MYKLILIIIIFIPMLKNSIASSNTRSQLKYARSVLDFSKDLGKGQINRTTITLLSKKHNWLFKDINPLIVRGKKLLNMRERRWQGFYRTCINHNKKRKKESAIYRIIEQKLDRYCRGIFLEISYQQKRTLKKELLFFKKNIDKYLDRKEVPNLIKYLKRIKGYKRRAISKIIANNYLGLDSYKRKTVNDKILKTLRLDREIEKRLTLISKENIEINRGIRNLNKVHRNLIELIKEGDLNNTRNMVSKFIALHTRYRDNISVKIFLNKFMKLGTRLIRVKFYDEANRIFNYAEKLGSRQDESNVLFHKLLGFIISEEWEDALGFIEKYRYIDKFAMLCNQHRFWAAYVIQMNDKKYLARHLYKQIIGKSSMLDYYNILAMGQLRGLDRNEKFTYSHTSLRSPASEYRLKNKNLTSYAKGRVQRISLWSKLGVDKFIFAEINELLSSSKNIILKKKIAKEMTNGELKSRLVVMFLNTLASNKVDLQIFKLVNSSFKNRTTNINSTILKKVFPFRFYHEIKKYADEIDPAIVLSLMRQESAFNPHARSSAGARGLMQLMPATAKMVRRKVRTKDLVIPKINIPIGVEYLQSMYEKFDKNIIYTLAAYNAGDRRVRDWQKHELDENSFPFSMIEIIPFNETKLYIKLIFRNIFFYKLLENDLNINIALSSVNKIFKH